jgi:hypothetical protein
MENNFSVIKYAGTIRAKNILKPNKRNKANKIFEMMDTSH